MNTFFYPAKASHCTEACSYISCSARCLSRLTDQPFYEKLRLLTGGSNLTSPSSLELRSGDLIILYAADDDDLDRLCSLKDVFNPFRIILLVAADTLMRHGKHYSLKPRYTTTINDSMAKLNTVIDRMTSGSDPLSAGQGTEEGYNYA